MSHFLCRKVVPHSRISLGSSARQHPAACVLFEAGNRPVCGDWTATVAKTNTIRYLKSQIKVTHHSCWFCRVLVQYLEPEAVLLRVNPTSHLRSIRPWTRLWCGGSHRRSVAIRLKCKFIQKEDILSSSAGLWTPSGSDHEGPTYIYVLKICVSFSKLIDLRWDNYRAALSPTKSPEISNITVDIRGLERNKWLFLRLFSLNERATKRSSKKLRLLPASLSLGWCILDYF